MTPQDAVKLLYQQEMGAGHLVKDSEESLARIRKEAAASSIARPPEQIGNGYARCYLSAENSEAELRALNRIFLRTAAKLSGSTTALEDKLSVLTDETKKGHMPFSVAELSEYLAQYRAEGTPAVSHSEKYRQLYSPAYRVVFEKYLRYMNICTEIEKLLIAKNRAVVAIDGRCGSGKSFHADIIRKLYDADVIEMDDFFLPPELRTQKRLQEPGGNIHYERFAEEVSSPISRGLIATYRVFDCGKLDYLSEKTAGAASVIVCEGTYSLNPKCGGNYDLKIFSTCSTDERLERIRRRSGEESVDAFVNRWIPMEETYFAELDVLGKCDIILDTTSVMKTV